MSEQLPVTPPVGSQPDETADAVSTREPWETPRVLVSEPFDSTHAGTDPDPMEGDTFYGPTS